MKHLRYYFISLLFMFTTIYANTDIQIVAFAGDVKVRYGLEEEWHTAGIGIVLKDVDTIFNGENARSVLKLNDGSTFTLGPNSVLDIADLRIILEKEMFLFLMSKKVDQIEHKNIKTELRIGNVSVIHGSDADDADSKSLAGTHKEWSKKEINGAIALHDQKYFSNSIIKLHNILSRYDTLANQEIIYFYIAKGFEALDKKGQAIDAYKNLIRILTSKNQSKGNTRKIEQAEQAIQYLSN